MHKRILPNQLLKRGFFFSKSTALDNKAIDFFGNHKASNTKNYRIMIAAVLNSNI